MSSKRQSYPFKMAVVALIDQGRTQTDIAEELGLSIKTVNRWWIKMRTKAPRTREQLDQVSRDLEQVKQELVKEIEFLKDLAEKYKREPATRARLETSPLIENRLLKPYYQQNANRRTERKYKVKPRFR